MKGDTHGKIPALPSGTEKLRERRAHVSHGQQVLLAVLGGYWTARGLPTFPVSSLPGGRNAGCQQLPLDPAALSQGAACLRSYPPQGQTAMTGRCGLKILASVEDTSEAVQLRIPIRPGRSCSPVMV